MLVWLGLVILAALLTCGVVADSGAASTDCAWLGGLLCLSYVAITPVNLRVKAAWTLG